MIGISRKIADWSVIVGLVGEGQEIHVGEESGMTSWKDAVVNANYEVVCAPKFAALFEGVCPVTILPEIDLNTSLRSHTAVHLAEFISLVLDGDCKAAKVLAEEIKSQKFDIYVTRTMSKIMYYCQSRYENNQVKRYGYVTSSKSYASIPVIASTRVGPWYIDERGKEVSCCNLTSAVTEFSCQGLELNLPVIIWGNDFLFEKGKWCDTKPSVLFRDSFKIRKERTDFCSQFALSLYADAPDDVVDFLYRSQMGIVWHDAIKN